MVAPSGLSPRTATPEAMDRARRSTLRTGIIQQPRRRHSGSRSSRRSGPVRRSGAPAPREQQAGPGQHSGSGRHPRQWMCFHPGVGAEAQGLVAEVTLGSVVVRAVPCHNHASAPVRRPLAPLLNEPCDSALPAGVSAVSRLDLGEVEEGDEVGLRHHRDHSPVRNFDGPQDDPGQGVALLGRPLLSGAPRLASLPSGPGRLPRHVAPFPISAIRPEISQRRDGSRVRDHVAAGRP